MQRAILIYLFLITLIILSGCLGSQAKILALDLSDQNYTDVNFNNLIVVGDSNLFNVEIDGNLFYDGELVDFNATGTYLIPIWAERGTVVSNGQWAFGNGQTAWGVGIYAPATLIRITAQCDDVGTDLGVEVKVNNTSVGCDVNVLTSADTTYSDACSYAINDGDIIGISAMTEVGAFTECIGTAWLAKDLNIMGLRGAAGAAGTGDINGTDVNINNLIVMKDVYVDRNITVIGSGHFLFVDKNAIAGTPATPPAGILRLYVEDINGFMFYSFLDGTGMKRKLVRDSVILAKNVRGSTIAANRIVYATGSSDNVPTIDLAQANSQATMPAIGVTIETCLNNNFCRLIQVGLLENVDTSSFNEGDVLYVSAATPGIPVTTIPIVPNLEQEIGTVLVSNATTGAIQIVARGVGQEETGTINDFHVFGDLNAYDGNFVNVGITNNLFINYIGADLSAFFVNAALSSLNNQPAFQLRVPASGKQRAFMLLKGTDSYGWALFGYNIGGTGKAGFELGEGGASARDVTLYREAANILKTDDTLIVADDINGENDVNVGRDLWVTRDANFNNVTTFEHSTFHGGLYIMPIQDNVTSLGKEGNEFKNLHIDGIAYIDEIRMNGTGELRFDADNDTAIFATTDDNMIFEAKDATRMKLTADEFTCYEPMLLQTTNDPKLHLKGSTTDDTSSFIKFEGEEGIAGLANVFSYAGVTGRYLVKAHVKSGSSDFAGTLAIYDPPPVDASENRPAGGIADIVVDEKNIVVHKHLFDGEVYDYAVIVPIVYTNMDMEAKTRFGFSDTTIEKYTENYVIRFTPEEWNPTTVKQKAIEEANERIAYRRLALRELTVETIDIDSLGTT